MSAQSITFRISLPKLAYAMLDQLADHHMSTVRAEIIRIVAAEHAKQFGAESRPPIKPRLGPRPRRRASDLDDVLGRLED